MTTSLAWTRFSIVWPVCACCGAMSSLQRMASRAARRLASLLTREAALVARLAALPAGGPEADMVKALTRKLFDVRVRRRNLGRNARRAGGLEEQVDLDKNSNVIKTTSDDVKEAEEEVAGEAGGDSELEPSDGEAWPCALPTCSSSNSTSRIHCRRSCTCTYLHLHLHAPAPARTCTCTCTCTYTSTLAAAGLRGW